jgi:hypothetical protein
VLLIPNLDDVAAWWWLSPIFLHIRRFAPGRLRRKKMENKIFSWMVVDEAAAAVCVILVTNVGFGLVGAVRFGDIGGEQERAALVDDDSSALWVIGDPFLSSSYMS